MKFFNKKNHLLEENTKIFLKNFSILLSNQNKNIYKKFLKFLTNSIQGTLNMKCFFYDQSYSNYIPLIKESFFLGMDSFEDINRKFKISETPILSCIWESSRVTNCLTSIGVDVNNPFIYKEINHCSYLIEPLGLILVVGGNHSINSAIIKNEGELIVKTKIDISPILNKYSFNGKNYIYTKTNKIVNFSFLKNNSEPFLYEFGLLFEIAKLLKKEEKKDYYNFNN